MTYSFTFCDYIAALILTRKRYINNDWFSPLVEAFFFIVTGLLFSFWPHGCGLAEWYFLS
jgi:hypothetical protein